MKRTARTALWILVAVWTCGVFDFAEGQFGGGGGLGGLGGAIGALVPGGCPMPTPVKNFDLEKVLGQSSIYMEHLKKPSQVL